MGGHEENLARLDGALESSGRRQLAACASVGRGHSADAAFSPHRDSPPREMRDELLPLAQGIHHQDRDFAAAERRLDEGIDAGQSLGP